MRLKHSDTITYLNGKLLFDDYEYTYTQEEETIIFYIKFPCEKASYDIFSNPLNTNYLLTVYDNYRPIQELSYQNKVICFYEITDLIYKKKVHNFWNNDEAVYEIKYKCKVICDHEEYKDRKVKYILEDIVRRENLKINTNLQEDDYNDCAFKVINRCCLDLSYRIRSKDKVDNDFDTKYIVVNKDMAIYLDIMTKHRKG